jgi:hypothetical protein
MQKLRRSRPYNAYVERETEVNIQGWQLSRASLKAIIAGTLAALVIMLAMSVLGLAIGATTLNAMIDYNVDPAFDPETGLVIWLAVTNLIALFVGGWVAGRMAGSPIELDGLIHGFVTWSLVTLLSLWLFTTTAGRFISGAASAVGEGLSVIDDGVAAVVPEAINAVENRDFALTSIRTEARGLAADSTTATVQPDAAATQQEGAMAPSGADAANTEQVSTTGGEQMELAVAHLLNLDEATDADRQNAVNIITANSNMTEDEARAMLDTWEQRFAEVDLATEETLEQVSETVTESIAAAAGVVFMAMVIGAFAAMAGGYIGSPEMPVIEDVYLHKEAPSES